MPVIVDAVWTATPGEEETVLEALRHLAPASREEPGNLCYQLYRSPDEPHVFRIFEVYADDDAVAAHRASDHFRRWAVDTAIPVLASREVTVYASLDI